MKLSHTTRRGASRAPAKQNQITVRRAQRGDVDALARIAQECFPDQIRWQVNNLAKKYWNAALDSSSCEIWIWLVNNETAGFSQIVIDIGAWEKIKRVLNYGLATRLLSLIIRPRLIMLKIRRKILLFQHRKNKGAKNDESEAFRTFQRHLRSQNSTFKRPLIHLGEIYLDPDKLIWHELAAVLPYYRKLWLALKIIRYCEKRAKKLRRYEICGVVEAIREHWCWMHERLGYKIAVSEPGRYTYVKFLNREG